jgi:hypothetical protein
MCGRVFLGTERRGATVFLGETVRDYPFEASTLEIRAKNLPTTKMMLALWLGTR